MAAYSKCLDPIKLLTTSVVFRLVLYLNRRCITKYYIRGTYTDWCRALVLDVFGICGVSVCDINLYILINALIVRSV